MYNRQDIFKENEIPYDDLLSLGISKKDILSLKKESLEALFTGNRTELMGINGIDAKGELFEFQAKISLYRKDNKDIGINIHPIRLEINNELGLKDKDIDRLKAGDIISKTFNREKFLIQLDNETNELLKARSKDILIPNRIKDITLDNNQKEALKQGKEIHIGDDLSVQLNLNNSNGIIFKSAGKEQAIEYDRINPNVRGMIQTDKNDNEFAAHIKSKQSTNLKL